MHDYEDHISSADVSVKKYLLSHGLPFSVNRCVVLSPDAENEYTPNPPSCLHAPSFRRL